jgi:hypothetical protein
MSISPIDRRLARQWALLVCLTLISWISYDGGRWLTPACAGVLAIALAAAKIRIVLLDFMAIREAPLVLRLPLEIWPVVLGGILIVLYLGVPG